MYLELVTKLTIALLLSMIFSDGNQEDINLTATHLLKLDTWSLWSTTLKEIHGQRKNPTNMKKNISKTGKSCIIGKRLENKLFKQ